MWPKCAACWDRVAASGSDSIFLRRSSTARRTRWDRSPSTRSFRRSRSSSRCRSSRCASRCRTSSELGGPAKRAKARRARRRAERGRPTRWSEGENVRQNMTITTRSPGASGCLFVVAAPSGGGKSSMVNALLERELGIRLSVSYTTRPPRPGESEGHHYHFIDVREFEKLRAGGEFLECAFVHGNWYATSATWLNAQVR